MSLDVEHNVSYINGVIDSYFEAYKDNMGTPHPYIKAEQLRRVKDVINDLDDTWAMDLGQWQKLIDRWFFSNVDSDFNVNHFAQEEILKNLYYELFY